MKKRLIGMYSDGESTKEYLKLDKDTTLVICKKGDKESLRYKVNSKDLMKEMFKRWFAMKKRKKLEIILTKLEKDNSPKVKQVEKKLKSLKEKEIIIKNYRRIEK